MGDVNFFQYNQFTQYQLRYYQNIIIFRMNQPVHLTMTHRYPFDQTTIRNQNISFVKLRRKFEQHEHSQLRMKIAKHSNITHPCLIKINKAFQSKKKKYFDIMFQWVRYSFRSGAGMLTYGQLQQKKLALLSLCQNLITLGIHPAIAEDMIGITQNKQIKLYVDVDFSPAIGPVEQLIRAKQIEISNIFRLYERASLFEHKPTPRASMHQVLGRSEMNQTKVVYQQFPKILPTQNIQVGRSIYMQNIQMTRSRSPQLYMYNIVGDASYKQQPPHGHYHINHGSLNQTLPSPLVQTIHEELQRDHSKMSQPQYAQSIKRSSKDMKPEKDVSSPEISAKIQKEIPNSRHYQKPCVNKLQYQQQREQKAQMMRQPRPFQLMMKERAEQYEEDQISVVDTYRQQLGQMRRMPKISNAQFRQTTKQPPSIIRAVNPQALKNRMSTGNPDEFKSKKLPLSRLQQQKSLQSQEQIKQQQQNKKNKLQYKVQNSYYYRQAFGFGFQRNDPLTREFISLLEDNPIIEQQVQPDHKQQKSEREEPQTNINQKVRQALKNSQRALEMFSKFKYGKNI